jgi:hypothetical protein
MRRRSPARFYALNLLRLDGQDLRNLPPYRAHLLYVDHLEARGMDLFRIAFT